MLPNATLVIVEGKTLVVEGVRVELNHRALTVRDSSWRTRAVRPPVLSNEQTGFSCVGTWAGPPLRDLYCLLTRMLLRRHSARGSGTRMSTN
jgi:hypothetical protein